jgi:hypothetical protein
MRTPKDKKATMTQQQRYGDFCAVCARDVISRTVRISKVEIVCWSNKSDYQSKNPSIVTQTRDKLH